MRRWFLAIVVLVVVGVLAFLVLGQARNGGSGDAVVREGSPARPVPVAPLPEPTLAGRGTGTAPPAAGDPEEMPQHPFPPGVTIGGTVVARSTGLPVPGAMVVFAAEGSGPVDVGSGVRTDAEGRFTVPADVDGDGRLHVLAHGLLPWSDVVAAGAQDVWVRLEEGGAIAGRVHDDKGQPVPGAAVDASDGTGMDVWPRGNDLLPDRTQRGNRTTSGEDGSFRIAGLAEGPYAVSAWKAGYFYARAVKDVAPGRDDVDLTLCLLVRARIVFRDAITGKEVQGAQMVFSPLSPCLVAQSGQAEWFFRDLEDRRGMLALLRDRRNLAGDPGDLRALIQVRHPLYQRKDVVISLREGEIPTITIDLDPISQGPSRRVVLRVDLPGGVPYTGLLEVECLAGRYVLAWVRGRLSPDLTLPVGPQDVAVEGARPVGASYPKVRGSARITVEEGGPAPQEFSFVLDAGVVALEVVDPEGRELADYDLDAHPAGKGGTGWYPGWRSAFTDYLRDMKDRGFSDHLPTRKPYLLLTPGTWTVSVRQTGYAPRKANVVVDLAGGVQDLRIEMARDR